MSEDNVSKPSGVKSKKRKVLLWLLLILIVLILVPLFVVPMYLSSDSGKNMILGKVNAAIDGDVTVRSLSVGWFKGVKADELGFKDSSGQTEVTAKQITAKPKYLSLLGGKLSIDSANITEPKVSIKMINAKGSANPADSASGDDMVSDASSPAFPIKNVNLTISDGNFKLETADDVNGSKTLELKDINSTLAIKSLGEKSSFDVSMGVANGDSNNVSSITAAGQLKTGKKEWSLKNSSGNLQVEIDGLDLAQLGPLFTLMDVDVNANGKISGKVDAVLSKGLFETVDSKINASNLDISGSTLKGDRIQSSILDAVAKFNTTETSINIEKLDIKADWLNAQVEGKVPMSLKSFEDFLQADSPDTLTAKFDCDMAASLAQIKNIAGFKENFDITHGRLSGDINTKAQGGKRIVDGKVKLWTLEGKFPVKQIVLSKPVELDARFVSAGEKINIEKLILDSSFANVSCKGTPQNLQYTGQVDFEKAQFDMGQFFDFKYKLAGIANLSGSGSFKDEVLASVGDAQLTNVTVTTPEGKTLTEPSANIEYDFKFDKKNEQLTVKSLDAKATPGNVIVSDLALPTGKGKINNMNINMLAAIDLSKAMDWAKIFDLVDNKMQLEGVARGDLSVNKNNDIYRVVTKKMTIDDFSAGYPGQVPFSQEQISVELDGMFDTANKIYDIKKLDVMSPQIKVAGHLTNSDLGDKVKTQGQFKADYELAAISTVIAPYMPQGLKVAGRRSDDFSFTSIYPKNTSGQLMANLNAQTSFGFDNAEYMGIELGKTEFDAKITNGFLSIAPFSTVASKGTLNFGANADFGSKPKLMTLPNSMKLLDKIQINSTTSDALLSYVNPLFADAVNVTGVLDFDCEKMAIPLESGYKKDIAVTGTLALDNVRLGASSLLSQIIQLTGVSRDPIITIMPTRLVLEDEKLSYANMEMDIDGKKINFAGTIWLDKRMQMNVTLPWAVNGQRITLPLKGTVNSPQIDTDKLLENQLQQQGEKLLKDLLKKI